VINSRQLDSNASDFEAHVLEFDSLLRG